MLRPDRGSGVAHPRAGDGRAPDRWPVDRARHVLDRDDDFDLHVLADPGVDDLNGPLGAGLPVRSGVEYPPRNSAISSSGRCVADRPIRCGGRSVTSSSRSRVSARWAPRLVVAIAWISSMITVSTPTSVSAAFDVSIRYSDSGVVINRSGGRRISFWRSFDGVSPVRIPTSGATNASPSRSAASSMPLSGARRFFSMSNASARNGEM